MKREFWFLLVVTFLVGCGETAERFRALVGGGAPVSRGEQMSGEAQSGGGEQMSGEAQELPGAESEPQLRTEPESPTTKDGAPAETEEERVMICHEPQGNPTNLIVLKSGLPGHLSHGDRMGEC